MPNLSLPLSAALGAAVIAASPTVTVADSVPRPQSREDEIALAESAAPAHVARDATIYVLGENGYTVARHGDNGFTCLVERSHPASLEPVCYDAEGSRAIVPRMLEVAAWRARGLDEAAIAARVTEGYRSGRFRAPRRTGVAYMLSTRMYFHDPATGAVERGHPHLMFYAPYLRNADIGSPGEANLPHRSVPFVIEEGTPHAYVIVLVDPPEAGGQTSHARQSPEGGRP